MKFSSACLVTEDRLTNSACICARSVSLKTKIRRAARGQAFACQLWRFMPGFLTSAGIVIRLVHPRSVSNSKGESSEPEKALEENPLSALHLFPVCTNDCCFGADADARARFARSPPAAHRADAEAAERLAAARALPRGQREARAPGQGRRPRRLYGRFDHRRLEAGRIFPRQTLRQSRHQ